jgi:hypothetical protein
MDFSKWLLEILHEIEYLVFQNYFVFFGKQFFSSSEIHVFRSDQFSLLIYRCLLPSSVTVKMDHEENLENARMITLLYESKIDFSWKSQYFTGIYVIIIDYYMSFSISHVISTRDTHISPWDHIPNQATWFLKTISSHKYEERRIEVYDK